MFITFSFLPIYNLFRFGQVGTISNVKEIEATNHASDLINFLREKSYSKVSDLVGSANDLTLKDDGEIKGKFNDWNLKVEKNYTRSLTLQRYLGNKAGWGGFAALIENFTKHRRAVPNFLAEVKITFKKSTNGPQDEVKLSTIIMD